MKKQIIVLLVLTFIVPLTITITAKGQISVSQVYGDGSKYCAFTSLIKTKGIYYLAFREASTHVSDGDYGIIRILSSLDCESWSLVQTLTENETDLRDPNLSVLPNGDVLLLCGARRKTENGSFKTTSEYSILSDGKFSNPVAVNYPKETQNGWIWKLTWHKGVGYAGCYKGESIDIVKTYDGISYDYITTIRLEGKQYETKILVRNNGEMMAFVRREPMLKGMMGISKPPYTNWSWKELDLYLAGQELLIDRECLLCITRTTYNIGSKTNLYLGDISGNFNWNISLPSMSLNGSDTGYAGIIKDGKYYVISYYSQTQNKKPAIFVVKIPKRKLKNLAN